MAYKTSEGITVLEGLEAVRRRSAMYIGAEDEHPCPRARLLELAVTDIALGAWTSISASQVILVMGHARPDPDR